jgi:hypothetical protein
MVLDRGPNPCTFCERVENDFSTEPQCEDCPVTQLTEKDLETWELYQAISTDFVYDFGGLELVFELFHI